jgi:hypothetical protein
MERERERKKTNDSETRDGMKPRLLFYQFWLVGKVKTTFLLLVFFFKKMRKIYKLRRNKIEKQRELLRDIIIIESR